MKKTIYLFLAVVLTTSMSISCNSDDNGQGGNNSSLIVGKWEITKTGVLIEGEEVLEDYEHQEGCNRDFTEFTNNGKMLDYTYYNYGSGCEEDIYESVYSVSANSLNITTEGETFIAVIQTLNSNTLKVRGQYESDEHGLPVITIAVFKRK